MLKTQPMVETAKPALRRRCSSKPNTSRGNAAPLLLKQHSVPKTLFSLLVIVLLLPIGWPAIAQEIDFEQNEIISDDNLLIVDIHMGQYKLAENVFVYTPPEANLIPLQPFFEAIEFPIEVEPNELRAFGWFLSPDNTFDLNVNNKSIIVGNEKSKLSGQELIISDDIDLYADLALIADWFDLNITMDKGRLRIKIEYDDKLPILQRLARDKKRDRVLNAKAQKQIPVKNDRYRLISPVMIDVNSGYTYIDQSEQSEVTPDSPESDSFLNLQATADFLFMETYFASSKPANVEETEKTLTFTKRPNKPGGSMLGGVEFATAGDVFAVSDSLIFDGGRGLGAELQFGGVSTDSDFGKKVIEGDGPPGWEVELYRNGTLVEFSIIGNDGRYRFEDVAVEYGENIFDIRLFGPQGQERSFRENIRVGNEMIPKGEVVARISKADLNDSVFDNEIVAVNPQLPNEKTFMQIKTGVTDWLGVGLTYAERKGLGASAQDLKYGGLNLSGALPGISLALDLYSQEDGGDAFALSGQTRIGSNAISFLHKDYDNFVSDRNQTGQLNYESELRITGLASFFPQPVSYQLTTERNEFINDNVVTQVDARIGFQFLNGRVTSESNYVHSNVSDESTWQGQTSYLRTLSQQVSLRASTSYSIEPVEEFTNASASAVWRPFPRLRAQFGFNSDLTEKGTNSFDLSSSYLFDAITLSLTATAVEGGDKVLTLSSEFSLGKEADSTWSLSGLSRARSGRAIARVYLDNDDDGRYSSGDEPLEGIEFAGRSEWDNKSTDQNGIVHLYGLSGGIPTRVKLKTNTLEDAYWKPAVEEFRVASHAGGLQRLNFPVTVTVEAEGTIEFEKNGRRQPVGGMPIIVEDTSGNIVAKTITEFDGFYVIEGLRKGEYLLKIDPKAIERFKIKAFKPVPFYADPDEGIIYIDMIVLSI